MKKILTILMTFFMVLCTFCGCSDKVNQEEYRELLTYYKTVITLELDIYGMERSEKCDDKNRLLISEAVEKGKLEIEQATNKAAIDRVREDTVQAINKTYAEDSDLKEYRSLAASDLDAYATENTKNCTDKDLAAIAEAVAQGKSEIEKSEDKLSIDKIRDLTQKEIDKICEAAAELKEYKTLNQSKIEAYAQSKTDCDEETTRVIAQSVSLRTNEIEMSENKAETDEIRTAALKEIDEIYEANGEYKKGCFYTMSTAYENGWLKREDLEVIKDGGEEEVSISLGVALKIRKTYFDQFNDRCYNRGIEDVYINGLYGIFGNCMVLTMNVRYGPIVDPYFYEKEIGGVVFECYNEFILVWKENI